MIGVMFTSVASMYGLYQHPNYSTNIITATLAK